MDGIRQRAQRNLRVVAATVLAIAGLSAAPSAAIAVDAINATIGSATAVQLAAPIVGVVATPDGRGYWRAARDGGVLTAGDALFYGSARGVPHDLIVGMAATPNGKGYWLVDRRGAVFHYGNAPFRGSMAGRPLTHPIVGIATTPNGQGYWLVASDGGIFAFNAPYRGSTGGMRLNKPIVGMAATTNGAGYWLVASDGGIFSFNAPYHGSTGGIRLNQPIVGMAVLPSGTGYTLVAADGGVFRFPGTSPFYGSAVGACPGGPAIGVTMSPGAIGYWIGFSDARTYAFSPSTQSPHCGPTGTSKSALAVIDVWQRLNAERTARGLHPLTWNPSLASYASSWSANMAANGFRHSNIDAITGYTFLGENIAMGSSGVTAGDLHVAWMHSDGHRANMLEPGFTLVGIGAYCASNGSIWLTQDFGRPSSAGMPPPPPPTPPVNPIVRSDPGTSHC
jgi:hypothetical protein